jgi:hypothetical protein
MLASGRRHQGANVAFLGLAPKIAPIRPQMPLRRPQRVSRCERMLLFNIANATDWKRAGVARENATVMIVKRLAVGRLARTDCRRAVLRAPLPDS